MHSRRTCSIGCPKPRSTPSESAATSSASRTSATGQLWTTRRAEGVIVNSMVHYYQPVDRAFAALADPTRRAVLERLGSGSATVSELAEPFGMSLTGMKKHILLLEDAELSTEKVGRVR